jgi:hypothetical protein
MDTRLIFEYLHLLFAFAYVASLFAAHWNMLAARRSASWAERAALAESNRRIMFATGLGSLLALGVLGNLLAMSLGYRMADTPTFRIVNGMWLVSLIVLAALDLPATRRLAAGARAAVGNGGGEPVDWNNQLGRWRLGNGLQLALFMGMLWMMVAPWRP